MKLLKDIIWKLKNLRVDLGIIKSEMDEGVGYNLISTIQDLLDDLVWESCCPGCGAILDASDITEFSNAVLEDALKTVIYMCPKCGTGVVKTFEWTDEDL